MGSFTWSEILTIVVIILIVFGPNRLPEMARKAGQWSARARRAVDAFTAEIKAEYGDTIEPLKEARDNLKGIGSELREGIASLDKDVRDNLGAAKESFEATVGEPLAANPGPAEASTTATSPADPTEGQEQAADTAEPAADTAAPAADTAGPTESSPADPEQRSA